MTLSSLPPMDPEWSTYLGLDGLGRESSIPALVGDVTGSYTEFCDAIDVELTPGQYAVALVAFDGLSIAAADRAFRDRHGDALPRPSHFYGGTFDITLEQRRVFVAVCGGRAGKTYAFTALRMLYLALTVPLDQLAPGEVGSAPIIAPDLSLVPQTLNYIKGALRHPRLAPFVVDPADIDPDSNRTSIMLRRASGKKVELVGRAANGKGTAGRGRSLVSAAMDEAAFFRDANYAVNDSEIYNAIAPRLLPGGQLIIPSTPWAQSGLLHDLFVANHGNPSQAGLTTDPVRAGTALAVHAPSWELRTDEEFLAVIRLEQKRDAENARREFGAQFMTSTAADFLDPEAVNRSITPDAFTPQWGDQLVAGIDLGFRSNSSALVIAYLRASSVFVVVVEERRPAPGMPLKPSEVMQDFARILKAHHCASVMADMHYRDTALEYLGPVGVGLIDAPPAPATAWLKVRDLLREGRLHLPPHERLLRQVRETRAKASSGGNVSIQLPHWPTGEHGDLAAAMALAVFQAAGPALKPSPQAGTPEAVKAREEQRIAHRQREMKQGAVPTWKKGLMR
jgi:hypothetical protein